MIGGAVSSASDGLPTVFGITSGASMNISFMANTLGTAATSSFGAGTMSSSWTVHRREVSFGFGSTMTTILFAGSGLVTLQGGAFEAAGGTSIFSNVKPAGGSTGLFGIAGSIPSFS